MIQNEAHKDRRKSNYFLAFLTTGGLSSSYKILAPGVMLLLLLIFPLLLLLDIPDPQAYSSMQ